MKEEEIQMLKRILVHTCEGALRVAAALILVIVSFLPAPFLDKAGFDSGVEVAQAIPVVTATKRDVLVMDNDLDGVADPGDTLRCAVVFANSGTTAAVNVSFVDTVDANTTLVAGSLRATPIGRHDT